MLLNWCSFYIVLVVMLDAMDGSLMIPQD